MGVQLLFVVEADKACRSDWIYIKELLDRFYVINDSEIKLTPIFLGGKGRYKEKAKINEINAKIKQYKAGSKDNSTVVIYVFDTDDYDSDPSDKSFMEETQKYCEKNGYKYVWFCKDVEQVFIGRQVPKATKRDVAADFKKKNHIKSVQPQNLKSKGLRKCASNIMVVLGEYLTEKKTK